MSSQIKMKSIARAYQHEADNVLSEMKTPWIHSIAFPGTFYSPREYNFSTDRLDMTVDIDEVLMRKYLDTLADSEDFKTYLHDNYTSYDGFMSFTPNTFNGIHEALTKQTEDFDLALGALITYAMPRQQDLEFYASIEGDVYDYWQGNGYEGLDYHYACNDCGVTMKWNDETGHEVCVNRDCKKSPKYKPYRKWDPKRKELLTKDRLQLNDRLFRNSMYTANDYWMIRTELEIPIIRKITSGPFPGPKDSLEILFRKWSENLETITFDKIWAPRESQMSHTNEVPFADFKTQDGYTVRLNGYFYRLMQRIGVVTYRQTQDIPLNAILCYDSHDTLIGVVMPCRIQ